MVRDKSGHVWAGWFDGSFAAKQGYYAVQGPAIGDGQGQGARLRAARRWRNNQPLESVALAARTGGGVYLAYCVPSKTVQCTHVALWKVGSARTKDRAWLGDRSCVARRDRRGPDGSPVDCLVRRRDDKIREVRTNGAATGFGRSGRSARRRPRSRSTGLSCRAAGDRWTWWPWSCRTNPRHSGLLGGRDHALTARGCCGRPNRAVARAGRPATFRIRTAGERRRPRRAWCRSRA